MGSSNPQDHERDETRQARSDTETSEEETDGTTRQAGVTIPTEEAETSTRSRWPSKQAITSGHPSVIAAVLSAVFPGGGQFYTRQLSLGVLVLLLQVFNILMFVNRLNIGAVAGVFIWLYSIWNAYKIGWKRAES